MIKFFKIFVFLDPFLGGGILGISHHALVSINWTGSAFRCDILGRYSVAEGRERHPRVLQMCVSAASED